MSWIFVEFGGVQSGRKIKIAQRRGATASKRSLTPLEPLVAGQTPRPPGEGGLVRSCARKRGPQAPEKQGS